MVSRADTCENLEARMPAVDHERTIRDYFDACTAGDARAIASFFAPDAVHYFPDGDTYPDGSPQRAFRGADAIGHGFGNRFGGEFRTRWTVDHVIVDAERREAVIEWSNFKPSVSPDARLRGAEFYRFDAAGKIVEIRAYYACRPAARAVRTSSASSTTRGAATRSPIARRGQVMVRSDIDPDALAICGSGCRPQRIARRSWSVTTRPAMITTQYWTMCGSPKLTLQRVTRSVRYVLASR